MGIDRLAIRTGPVRGSIPGRIPIVARDANCRTHFRIGLMAPAKMSPAPQDKCRPRSYGPIVRSQKGQTAAEYLGFLLVISVIVAAVATTGIGTRILDGMQGAVCKIAQQACADDSLRDPVTAGVDTDGDGVADATEERNASPVASDEMRARS